MNAELGEFLRSQWSTASPNQYGSKTNPYVGVEATSGQRLSNGQRVGPSAGVRGLGSVGQAPPIGTTPEVPITASTIGVSAPDCGPKMQAVIDPTTGRWICQPAGQSGGIGQLIMYVGLGYLAYLWWKDQGKGKRRHHKPSEEIEDDAD